MKLPIKVYVNVKVKVLWREHILGEVRVAGDELEMDKGEALACPAVEIITGTEKKTKDPGVVVAKAKKERNPKEL